jgi:GTP-binding protein Era
MNQDNTKKIHRAGYIAVIGRPNAGKSTLIDRLIGEKAAIVSSRPQTTRNKILCILSTAEAQLIFLDTPGLHKPMDKLGEHMVKAAEDSLKDVDAVVYVVDASEKRDKAEKYILERLHSVHVPVILVLNKIDVLPNHEALLPKMDLFQKAYPFHSVYTISALHDSDFKDLLGDLVSLMPEGPSFYPEDMYTDQTERVMAAEIIREKILYLTTDEVPHAVAVQVHEMKTRDNGMVYVRADIYVERESQKGILIGRKGQMLKKISQMAREDIEKMLGTQVYLELWVKVRPKWREKESDLKQFGLGE